MAHCCGPHALSFQYQCGNRRWLWNIARYISTIMHTVDVFSCFVVISFLTSLWRHNGRDGVSNHQHHDCLLNRSFRPRSKKTSKLRVTGLRAGYSPVTGEFPAQMASNAENVSIWWRHHGRYGFCSCLSQFCHWQNRNTNEIPRNKDEFVTRIHFTLTIWLLRGGGGIHLTFKVKLNLKIRILLYQVSPPDEIPLPEEKIHKFNTGLATRL